MGAKMTSKCKTCGYLNFLHTKFDRKEQEKYGIDIACEKFQAEDDFLVIEGERIKKLKYGFEVKQKKGCGKKIKNSSYTFCGVETDTRIKKRSRKYITFLCPSCSSQSPQRRINYSKKVPSDMDKTGDTPDRDLSRKEVSSGTQTLSSKIGLGTEIDKLWIHVDDVKTFIAQETEAIKSYKKGRISFEVMMRVREKLAGWKLIK